MHNFIVVPSNEERRITKHVTRAEAEYVARSLADRYKGEEFTVYKKHLEFRLLPELHP